MSNRKRYNEGKPMPSRPTLRELGRFLSFCKEEIDGKGVTHWTWQGRKDRKGYGLFCFRRIWMGAHRFSIQAFKGPLKYGNQAHHDRETCGKRDCVHPDCLHELTESENSREGRHYQNARENQVQREPIPF